MHHITSRGVARPDIFFDDADRDVFLQQLAHAHRRGGIVMHASCLMTHHSHLELQTPAGHRRRSRQWGNQHDASHVHRRSQRAGHLLQGRCKHVLVEAEAHLHELTRSMHLNPVRAGMVTAPALSRWSSSHDDLGLRQPPTWLDLQQTVRHFGHAISQQRQRSQECVAQALVTNPMQSMVCGAVLGSKDFVATVRSRRQPPRDDRAVAQLVTIRPGVPLRPICHVFQRDYGLQDAA